jgi:hypothetical protein
MGSCCGGSAPQPPNPYQTAAAQTGTNVGTAIANSYLGNVNQQTPQGNLTYDINSYYNDPTSGQPIPRWTATQTLTPQGQEAFNQQQGAQVNLASMANQQAGSLRDLLGTSFNPAQTAPGAGDINWYTSVTGPMAYFDAQPAAQYGYGSGGDITRSYGPQDNFSADRARVEEAMFQRLNPQLKVEEDRVNQRLADQGLRAGGEAYRNAYDVYGRQANDARLGVIERGGAEQQRLAQMAQQQAAFQNEAQRQAESQLAARGAFYNAAQAQGFGQAQGRAGFYNQAQQQALNRQNTVFNAQNQLHAQNLAEQYQQRAQPINEITALLSGSQVQQPTWANVPRTQIPTTDVAGLINQNFAQQNDIYKTQQQSWNDIMGGLLGAGGNIGAAYLRSDRDVKENVVPMGTVFSDSGKKLPIYQYSYKDDPAERRHVGPMAQDVEKIKPSAVAEIDGVKHINLDRMGSVFGRGAHG